MWCKGCATRGATGCKGCKGCLHIQNFCNHFAFWWRISHHLQRPQLFCRYSAISLPLLHFPAAPFPHPALFRNVLLPRQFMLLSSARPRLKDLQRQPICQMWHTHTHTHPFKHAHVMPCHINIVMGAGAGELARPLTHRFHIRNARNWKWQNKIVKTVKICCIGYPHFAAERMLLDNNFNFTTPLPPSDPACCM